MPKFRVSRLGEDHRDRSLAAAVKTAPSVRKHWTEQCRCPRDLSGPRWRRPASLEPPRSISFGCGSSGGASRRVRNDVAGVAGLVDAVAFLGEVVAPVVFEVAVAAKRAA